MGLYIFFLYIKFLLLAKPCLSPLWRTKQVKYLKEDWPGPPCDTTGSQLRMCTPHIEVLALFLAALFWPKFHSQAWGTADDGPATWISDSYLANPNGVPGSWLWAGPVPTVEFIWGVNLQIVNQHTLSSSLHPSLPSALQISKQNN